MCHDYSKWCSEHLKLSQIQKLSEFSIFLKITKIFNFTNSKNYKIELYYQFWIEKIPKIQYSGILQCFRMAKLMFPKTCQIWFDGFQNMQKNHKFENHRNSKEYLKLKIITISKLLKFENETSRFFTNF